MDPTILGYPSIDDPYYPLNSNFNLTTRFKNEKILVRISGIYDCNLVLERIICIGSSNIAYLTINGDII